MYNLIDTLDNVCYVDVQQIDSCLLFFFHSFTSLRYSYFSSYFFLLFLLCHSLLIHFFFSLSICLSVFLSLFCDQNSDLVFSNFSFFLSYLILSLLHVTNGTERNGTDARLFMPTKSNYYLLYTQSLNT